MIHSIFPIQFMCPPVISYNLFPSPFWYTSWSGPSTSHYIHLFTQPHTHTHTHTHTTVLLLFWNLPGTTQVSRYQKGKTRKVKTNLDLLEQEIVSGSGISWAICKSAPHPGQPLHPTTQFFYRPDALSAAQLTASKH